MEILIMATATLNKPLLQLGTVGDAVKEVQQLLNDTVYPLFINLNVDGQFGPATERAVRQFQHQVLMPVDGVVADRTWRALFKQAPVDMPLLQFGDIGDFVVFAQALLAAGNYYLSPIDGDFGPATRNAVIAFQAASGIAITGILDDATWYLISKRLRSPLV
jgi:peptidoglycan hydrolase-like protein with peptidoglycan-binding domain